MPVGNKGKIAIIILTVVLAVGCSIGGVAIMQKKAPAQQQKQPVVEEPAEMMPIGEIIVNLADAPEIHYLKTNIVLEVVGKVPEAAGEADEMVVKAPLRDAIIEVLSAKRLSQINRPDGKNNLKSELQTVCEKRLPGVRVTNVYFSEFAMQ